jgi:hypothetical protein
MEAFTMPHDKQIGEIMYLQHDGLALLQLFSNALACLLIVQLHEPNNFVDTSSQ